VLVYQQSILWFFKIFDDWIYEINYYDPYIAQYVHPKKAYKVKLKDADKDFIFNETEADLNKFDKIIDELDSEFAFTSIKKYIKQNAKVVF
jgi:hypothetical protein